MAARIIDGKAVAASLRAEVAAGVAAFKAETGAVPGLAVVLVGEDAASQVYVRNKNKAAEGAGMRSETIRLPAHASEAALLDVVARLNADPGTDGILVQLPLPAQIREGAVIEAIDPAKDVDGFHPVNVGRLWLGQEALAPCTPTGVMRLLAASGTALRGAHAVVVGRSNIVGKPMAQLLLRADCTVTIAHSRTRDLPALARSADVLVAAVGRAEMVRGDWVKPGAAVIDVGINRVPGAAGKDRLVGDVHHAEAAAVAGAITPVPGGVGPMTIACLLENTLKAARARRGLVRRA
ncbi:MAG: bifunctional methylenetetrahydrofolate dehydrogenase/methenyltetrahydrofolate cyclohydrolase FolD [Alphaproteobacteria bacterium]|nr:bifunctional methylenetetrahydrofolate dehydrogenase/methenyltetrahydrofolate cyclohydrolase FolD [Alphaproteobacteria bacterium]